MDKFVIRQKNNAKSAVNVTAADRARNYAPGVLHSDKGLLFCPNCNVVLDHLRKSVIDRHLSSTSHKEKTNKTGKQQTLKTALECKTEPQLEKVKVCQEWIKACTAANVPLHKSDNSFMRRFLQNRVVNGGAIPKSSQLRDYYPFDVYDVEKAELKQMVKDKNMAIIVDELSDLEGRYVLDILAVLLDFDELSLNGNTVAYLLESHFLSVTNNKTMSQAIVKTVHDYGIDYDNVRVFNSDNVGYMKKAYNDTLSCLFPRSVHITCHSHVVNLVASDFKKVFKEVNEFTKCFRNLFYVLSGRKSRLLAFLKNALQRGDGILMPPNPTTKSWGAWFESVLYHADHFFLFPDFIKEELDRGRSTACNSLLRLEEMYDDNSFMKKLQAHFAFLKVKAPTIKVYMDYFQQRVPHVTDVHDKMDSLMYYLDQNAKMQEDDLEFCFQGNSFSQDEKEEMVQTVNSAFGAARSKLQKYIVDGAQPAVKFLEQVQLLNPMKIVSTESSYDAIDSIPGFETVSTNEWDLYINRLGPAAVKGSSDGNLDVALFWKSNAAELPELYKLASCFCTTTIGSYDVERAFSAYNDILDDKRRTLNQKTIKAIHFLNWNLRVKSSLEQEKCQPKPAPTSTKQDPKDRTGAAKQRSQIPVNFSKYPPTCVKAPLAQQQTKRKASQTSGSDSNKKRKENGSKPFSAWLKTAVGKSTSHLSLKHGVDHEISHVFTGEDKCTFPLYKEPLLNLLLDEADRFSGSNLIAKQDLNGLVGSNKNDEENYLSNFVIDAYLQCLATDCASEGVKVETLKWEAFDKANEKKQRNEILKGKAPLLEQEFVLVPCNPGATKHWTLLVLKPQEKEIFVLDSKATTQVKPSATCAIEKMWSFMQEIEPNLDVNDWSFSANTAHEIPQQPNAYDCGAYVCAYARCLLLESSMPSDVPSFWKHIALELHQGTTLPFNNSSSPQVGHYYAVEYQRNKKSTFYIGRALASSGTASGMKYKFLHSIGVKVFDWPKRDDVDTCHDSCVFYGPVSIVGNGPFTVQSLAEIEQVFTWVTKSRKTGV